MIAQPLNDRQCLQQLSELAANGAQNPAIIRFAGQFETTNKLAQFIRTLPQLNDDGNDNGPKILCDVPQRARKLAANPNCFERSLFYLSVAEVIDPAPLRQLTTIDTPAGRHTYPVEDGLPVVLDPTMNRNMLHAGIYAVRNAQGEDSLQMYTPDETLTWLADVAEYEARNGRQLRHVARARDAFEDMLDGRQPAARNAAADIGYTLALADRALPMWGADGRRQLDIAAVALQRVLSHRNFSFSIPGLGKVGINWSTVRKLGENLAGPAIVSAGASIGIPPVVTAPIAAAVTNQLKAEKKAEKAIKAVTQATAATQATTATAAVAATQQTATCKPR